MSAVGFRADVEGYPSERERKPLALHLRNARAYFARLGSCDLAGVRANPSESDTRAEGLHGVIRSPKCSRDGWILTDFPLGGDGRDGAR